MTLFLACLTTGIDYRILETHSPCKKNAFNQSKIDFENNIPSWYGSILKLKQILNYKDTLSTQSSKGYKTQSRKIIKSHYINEWRSLMETASNGKLTTYVTYKSNFGQEKYLSLLPFDYRRNLSKFRISGHK